MERRAKGWQDVVCQCQRLLPECPWDNRDCACVFAMCWGGQGERREREILACRGALRTSNMQVFASNCVCVCAVSSGHRQQEKRKGRGRTSGDRGFANINNFLLSAEGNMKIAPMSFQRLEEGGGRRDKKLPLQRLVMPRRMCMYGMEAGRVEENVSM